jgi:N-methylhydantoinase B
VPYTKIMAGDRIVAIGPAGGGYGDPLEREPEQVLSDVLDEYITAETAERDYGVVIADGAVVQAATDRSRAAMRIARK